MATYQGGGYGQRSGGQAQGGYGNDRCSAPAVSISVDDIKLQAPLSVDLFDRIAKDKAAIVAIARKDNLNESTQLRKFYDELVMWTDKVHNIGKLEAGQKSESVRVARYEQSAPFIKMLNAKVAYAKGRKKVDECFEEMFSKLIGQIDSPDSLKHAKLFMEAFMGFYKAQEK
ncbi:MAG: type III-A CRISPR-associated protein Csm2 [Rhodoferax sp.]|nr:type III-A CRISPR-associated protein Csm2 [Rhodoferax sp.]PIW07276.1 MAG: type III-A CRISPR-associated protein Csm2 [Comamonadaceae bacterium CG17_big_fil_post_rev_8_21_14_2_50_60_13]PIY24815.1 MAG: type III-A CRISPR-associated protein Csm2 [Comamonadaceae bacterium CG_4_10_14_3_um_filter_60_75]PJC19735.1 MAG: type III-A CRISPR-associated protein Csm2 [Comamonadaceae bacterium CG_4_9_14_0_8_um_filter_60_18]